MKKVYQLSGTPARPPIKRTPEEEEIFQLSKELLQEVRSASQSRFWKKREEAGGAASPEDFDSQAIEVEMKKKYPLVSEEQISRELKRRIYLHYLR